MRWRIVLSGLLLLGLLGYSSLPARQSAAGKEQGFRLTIANGMARDVTSARLAALYVLAGSRPSPFVPPGEFTATWEGEFQLDLPEEVTLSAEGRGKLTIRLKDQVLLDLSGEDFAKSPGKKVEIPGGPVPVTIVYQAPKTGDAVVRVAWQGSNFVREPVNFAFVQHDPSSREQSRFTAWREGRALVANLHCVNCHRVADGALPELKADVPNLAGIGARVQEPWLAAWIQDPQSLRPQATMPRLLSVSEKGAGAEARDLAAYLITLGAEAGKEEPAPADETVNLGARLFSHLGCISCHLMPTRESLEDEEYQRVPLRFVGAKWKPAALRAFLRNPTAHYEAIPMPNFNLSTAEAEQISAFLLKTSQKQVAEGPYVRGDAARGKELLTSKGCLACHAIQAEAKLTPPVAPSLADLKKLEGGCLSADVKPGGKLPIYTLSAEQRSAVRGCLSAGPALFQHDTPTDYAERSLRALRCNSCHQRDGREDAWSRLRDEGDALLNEYPGEDAEKDPIGQPFPAVQLRPPLTWTGEKLRPEWLAAFLTGKMEAKPRPYLRARMPHFRGAMDLVAVGLVLQHGRPPKSPAFPPVDEKMAEVGRQLTAKKNWGCVACHNVGKSVAEAAFEAPGLNFSLSRERLTRDYFERWVYSPLRVEAGTKMPAVFQPGKKSLLDQFFEGNTEKQVEAIWQYLQMGDRIQYPPE